MEVIVWSPTRPSSSLSLTLVSSSLSNLAYDLASMHILGLLDDALYALASMHILGVLDDALASVHILVVLLDDALSLVHILGVLDDAFDTSQSWDSSI